MWPSENETNTINTQDWTSHAENIIAKTKVEIEGFASKVLEEAMRLVETLFADMNGFHEVRTANTNQTIAFATNDSPNTFGVKPVDNRVAKMSKVLEQFTDNME